jgi:hypothetical protein
LKKEFVMSLDYDLVRERVKLAAERHQWKRPEPVRAHHEGNKCEPVDDDGYRVGHRWGLDWAETAMCSGKSAKAIIGELQHQVAAMYAVTQIYGSAPAARTFGHLAGMLEGLREAV